MLNRFMTLKIPVKKALIDFKLDSMFPSEEELDTIAELVTALDTIETCTRQLN